MNQAIKLIFSTKKNKYKKAPTYLFDSLLLINRVKD